MEVNIKSAVDQNTSNKPTRHYERWEEKSISIKNYFLVVFSSSGDFLYNPIIPMRGRKIWERGSIGT